MTANTSEPDQPRVQQYDWCTPDLHGTKLYEDFCRSASLPPVPDGYGLLLIIDGDGRKHTLATTDVLYLSMLHHGVEEYGPMEISFPTGKFAYVQEGWVNVPPRDQDSL
ncbi:hypothetical protein [Streptomyces sp. NPDC012825]|uniref:hypothetical protein n=1 Tax=Streptomyces sp. NPDC012825 TaxID=3364851 RepID=UPI0036B3EA8B